MQDGMHHGKSVFIVLLVSRSHGGCLHVFVSMHFVDYFVSHEVRDISSN